jgi:rhodanese-related sulfurtransferase
MAAPVDANTLKGWLSDGAEIALLDVREHGQYGAGHPFFAVPLAYSTFELRLPALVPNPAVRVVLCDDGDGVAGRAAARAQAMGYGCVHILAGGAPAWQAAGYTLFDGVNLPSKTFGELIEIERHTPRVTAQQLEAMRRAGDNMVIVDGRTFAEFQRMNIPGGISCPNGELALHIHALAPDPETRIVVNCAGRTRSIIGAQTLIDFGVPNPVVALENGTQGWFLAGLDLERGAARRYDAKAAPSDLPERQVRARALAGKHGVAFVEAAEARRWCTDASRTTYLLDVRSPEEFAERGVPGFAHAPGGQLIQATDQWVAVRGARLVLMDDELVRAPVVAAWLRQLGHEACVLDGGAKAAAAAAWPKPASPLLPPEPTSMPASAAAEALRDGAVQIVDLRPSMAYRKGHIAQAIWSIRPRVAKAVGDKTKAVLLVADDAGAVALAALDLREAGCSDIRLLQGGHEAWRGAGLAVTATPGNPPDADCIDFVFHTHLRHDGSREAAQQYLAWEVDLPGRLDAQERGVFRI